MRVRSNAAKHFTADEVIHSCGQEVPGYPQGDPACFDSELVWLNGSESPIDRQTLLGELYAERFGLRGRRASR